MQRRVIGIGETVLDIIFENDCPKAAVPGGSTFNSLISLGRTAGKAFPDTKIMMVTQTGDDHVGDIVVNFLKDNGVETSAVSRSEGTLTNVSLAFLDSSKNAQFEFYKDPLNDSLQPETREMLRFTKDDIVLFGSYFAVDPAKRDVTASLLHSAHRAGAIIYYDVNFRRNHIPDLPQTMDNILENCSLSTFVRGSDEDIGHIFGTKDPEKVYSEHIRPLCPNFICTCGPEPVHVFTPAGHSIFPAQKTETVSTIGAGDNFNAGFIYGLLAGNVTDCNKLNPTLWGRLIHSAGLFSAEVCRSIFNYVRGLPAGLSL